jgi:hypothetical protein
MNAFRRRPVVSQWSKGRIRRLSDFPINERFWYIVPRGSVCRESPDREAFNHYFMRTCGAIRKAQSMRIWLCLAYALSMGGQADLWGQEVPLVSPRSVVERWLQVYPGQMEQAAKLTTPAFREGLSKEEWVATRGPFLRNLGMKYVRAKVVHDEMIEDEAHVMVHAHIVTLMGDHPQDELYILVSDPDGGWLIKEVEVYTEAFNRVP